MRYLLMLCLLSLSAEASVLKKDLQTDEDGNMVVVRKKKKKAKDRMTLCPDGKYVYGKCEMTPNGDYIGVPTSE